jgi:hypothetical protein
MLVWAKLFGLRLTTRSFLILFERARATFWIRSFLSVFLMFSREYLRLEPCAAVWFWILKYFFFSTSQKYPGIGWPFMFEM